MTALKDDSTMVELATKFDIYGNQITDWNYQLVEQSEAGPRFGYDPCGSIMDTLRAQPAENRFLECAVTLRSG